VGGGGGGGSGGDWAWVPRLSRERWAREVVTQRCHLRVTSPGALGLARAGSYAAVTQWMGAVGRGLGELG
jgi:hypothetical protein